MTNEVYNYQRAVLKNAIIDLKDELESNYFTIERELSKKPAGFNQFFHKDLIGRFEQHKQLYEKLIYKQEILTALNAAMGD